MNKIITYLEDSYNELVHKVTWPTWKELQNSAVVVMVASLIIALIIYFMDTVFRYLMELIYGMFY